MYVDKPMAGHNLVQAIARVNRVFKGKEGGLVVDYIESSAELKNALAIYTQAKGKGEMKPNQKPHRLHRPPSSHTAPKIQRGQF